MAPTFLALLAQQLHALLRDKGVALLVVGAPVVVVMAASSPSIGSVMQPWRRRALIPPIRVLVCSMLLTLPASLRLSL